MLSILETKIVLTALLFLIPITGGLATFTLLQTQESKYLSNAVNGYVEPKWLGYEIEQSQKSMVTVNCSGSLGSGFSFDFDEMDKSKGFAFGFNNSNLYASYIVTNAHVIENCRESDPKVSINEKVSDFARIISIDIDNDLALLGTNLEIQPLFGTYTIPLTGYWVMALGSPHSFEGSVTFGNVINRDNRLVFTTASLSPGNSGGPLIDNSGFVFGVNSGSKPIGQNFNISIGINSFCEKLIVCPKGQFWQE